MTVGIKNNKINHNYMTKEESKYRPWTFAEAPLLVIFKSKCSDTRFIFNNVSDSGYSYRPVTYSFEIMLEEYLYSSDNGKTWLPCGTLI